MPRALKPVAVFRQGRPAQVPAIGSMFHAMSKLNRTTHGCREPCVERFSLLHAARCETDRQMNRQQTD